MLGTTNCSIQGNVSKDAESYFSFGTYCDNVLNVSVVATARALKLNLTIYTKGLRGNIQILKYTKHATGKEVHSKFTCDPCNVANNHYEAILLLNKPTERNIEEEVTIESPCPNTSEQPISLDDADDVIYLTEDSEMVIFQQSDSVQYNTSNNELQFPIHLFVYITEEWVDDLPHDIDGFKILQEKCSQRGWV